MRKLIIVSLLLSSISGSAFASSGTNFCPAVKDFKLTERGFEAPGGWLLTGGNPKYMTGFAWASAFKLSSREGGFRVEHCYYATISGEEAEASPTYAPGYYVIDPSSRWHPVMDGDLYECGQRGGTSDPQSCKFKQN